MSSSFREKVARNLSLTGWMRNRRLTLILSFVLAIVLWAVVMSNSNNIQTRTMTVPVRVDLTDTYAGQIGLRLTSESEMEVSVTVRGAWSVLSTLSADDVRVRADVSTVQKAGKQEVALLLSRNSEIVNYDLVSCTPSVLVIDCDYWDTRSLSIQPDIASLKVADETSLRLGKPVMESVLSDGTLTLSGPQTTLNKISSLVARVAEEKTLTETSTFRAAVVALDESGAEVALDHCTFAELDGADLALTVPVEAYKELTFTYEWLHAPEALADASSVLTLSPESVKIIGPVDAVNALSDQWSLGKIDFDTLTNRSYEWKIPLKLADSVSVVGDEVTEVLMKLDLSDRASKTLSLPLSSDTVAFENKPAGKTATVQAQTVSVTLYGPAASLDNLTADDLSVTVDLSGATGSGLSTYTGRVKVGNRRDVWVNYGKDNGGVDVYVTLS